MLDQHEISVGCLTTYAGFILGIGLLVLTAVLGDDDLGRWGVSVLVLACTYSLHRSISVKIGRMQDGFEMGRDYERTQRLTSIR